MAKAGSAKEGGGQASVTTSSTVAVADNSNRGGLTVVNDSDTTVYLGLGETAVANKGIRLNANGGSWDGKVGDDDWVGVVNAIHAGTGTKVLTYVEL